MEYKGVNIEYKNVGNNKYKLTACVDGRKLSATGNIDKATKALQSYIDELEVNKYSGKE